MADEARLLEIASAVADGSEIDWDKLAEDAAGEPEPSVLVELRRLSDIVRAMRLSSESLLSEQSTDARPPIPNDDPTEWGHLRILEKRGGGTYGVVYRAWDTHLECDVALKLARPVTQSSAFDESRALKEARLLARVRHPNVVKVHGADDHDGRFGLWMELVEGRTLEQILEGQGQMGAQEAAHVGMELCHALAAVHGAGLLHRDIKASNVMREKGGRIVLMDFGAGRLMPAPASKEIGVAGTPLYLAPELFAGDGHSTASDIYSVGVLLYHLLTTRYPIDAKSVEAIELAHRRNDRRQLRDARPDLPASFVTVIERAMSPLAAERYQTAGAFGNALAAASGFSDRRVAEPAPAPGAIWRNPLAVGIAAGVLVLIGIATMMIVDRSRGTGSATNTAANAVPATTVSTPPGGQEARAAVPDYQVEAAFFALRDEKRVRLANGSAVAPGDRIFLDLALSQPAYVYVVNQDDSKKAYVLFPLEGQQLGNPVPGGQFQLPGPRSGVSQYWQVSSAGGREHFLVYVSPTRLVEFESLLAALPRAEAGRPVETAELSASALGVLRSVGGLTAAPASSPDAAPSLTGLQMLPQGPESARGVWARQISFANPQK